MPCFVNQQFDLAPPLNLYPLDAEELKCAGFRALANTVVYIPQLPPQTRIFQRLFVFELVIMRLHYSQLVLLFLAPITSLAAPASENVVDGQPRQEKGLHTRENLCSLKVPPALCQPNSSVTVTETALRAYKFYRAFVVDGDPRTMFSLIDSTYKVSLCLAHSLGPPQQLGMEKLIRIVKATPRRLRRRAQHNLAALLQRQQDRDRAEHRLVL